MKLELFNSDFIRIGKISQYSYASYNHDSESYGKFLIDCAPTENLMSILPEVEYILFEDEAVGVFNYEDIQSIESYDEISLKGYMLKSVLSYRTLFPQFSETLPPEQMLRKLVLYGFIDNPNPDKNEPRFQLDTIEYEESEQDSITLQVTGSDIFSECQKISKTKNVFFEVVPVMKSYNEKENLPANIDKLVFKTRKQRDLSIGNAEGNTPVVFSYNLSNIETGGFNESRENYKNIAIVAGEGSSSERSIEYVSDSPIRMPADEHTLSLMHMSSLTDEVERDFTMTKGSTAVFTNENTRFGSKNGFFQSEATSGYFQFTNPVHPAGDVTWEWWEYRVEPYSTDDTPPYVLCTDTSTNRYGACLMRDTASQEFLVGQIGTGGNSTNLLPANTPMGTKLYKQWVHRAVVLEWKLNSEDSLYYLTIRFYENGKLFGEYVNSTGRSTPVAVYGSTNGLIGKYNGGKSAIMYVEEIRISDIARYSGKTYKIPSLPFNVSETTGYEIPKGLKRKEIFVDARDLQSTDNKGKSLTAAEYKNLMILRGLDKLNDYIVVRNVSATLSEESGKQYQYGRDYMEGDIVSLILDPIKVEVSIPIARVTKTQQGSLRYTDIEFGKVKNFIRSQLRKENLL